LFCFLPEFFGLFPNEVVSPKNSGKKQNKEKNDAKFQNLSTSQRIVHRCQKTKAQRPNARPNGTRQPVGRPQPSRRIGEAGTKRPKKVFRDSNGLFKRDSSDPRIK
jgi:hypothetical protein